MSRQLGSYQSKNKLDNQQLNQLPNSQEIIESQQPQENLILLKQQNDSPIQNQSQQGQIQLYKQKLKKIKQQISQTKSQISRKRQQLRQISEKIQNQLQKAILKPPAVNNKSIASYFSKQQQLRTQKQKQLKAQIKKTRAQIQKVKKELSKFQEPKLNGITTDKFIQYKNILQAKTEEAKALNLTKQGLKSAVENIDQSILNLHLEETDQIVRKHLIVSQDLNKQLKNQRNKLNNLEREDRIYMEKLKYLSEVLHQGGRKKQTISRIDEQRKCIIEEQMKSLNEEIKHMLSQKYRIQNEIKLEYESLKSNKQKTQKQNWNIITKLRQYDSFLLNYYNSIKLQKKKKQSTQQLSQNYSKKQQRQSQIIKIINKRQEQVASKIETVQTPQIKYQKYQKQHLFEFQCQDLIQNIITKDHFQQHKSVIDQFILYHNQSYLLGINCVYKTTYGIQSGYKIITSLKPKDAKTKHLKIKDNDFIREINIGVSSQQNQILYIKILTKQKKYIQWGNPSEIQIKNYLINEYISIKAIGCLRQYENSESPNEYYLHGLGFAYVTEEQRKIDKRNKNTGSIRIKKILM